MPVTKNTQYATRNTDAINLHIDRLILDGIDLPSRQRSTLQGALESELARLLESGGLASGWRNGGAAPSLPAAQIHLADEVDPGNLGQQIARTIYEGFGK